MCTCFAVVGRYAGIVVGKPPRHVVAVRRLGTVVSGANGVTGRSSTIDPAESQAMTSRLKHKMATRKLTFPGQPACRWIVHIPTRQKPKVITMRSAVLQLLLISNSSNNSSSRALCMCRTLRVLEHLFSCYRMGRSRVWNALRRRQM